MSKTNYCPSCGKPYDPKLGCTCRHPAFEKNRTEVRPSMTDEQELRRMAGEMVDLTVQTFGRIRTMHSMTRRDARVSAQVGQLEVSGYKDWQEFLDKTFADHRTAEHKILGD